MRFLLTVLVILFAMGVQASPVQRLFQDVKLPTQKVIEHQSWAAPAAGDTAIILASVAGPTSAAATTVSTFSSQPDFARNLVLTAAGGTASDLNSCVVTVNGTNWAGSSISETFTFSSGVKSAQTGNKAFLTVTSVSFPASCEGGAFSITWALGTGSKFGLKRCLANAGDNIKELLDGATATAGTWAADASHMESNTLIFNTSANASHNFDAYYMQNYGCFK